MLPGLTFQHLDGHFHSGLRMAQAVSRGLHHLSKGPRAEGTSWEKMIPQPPGSCSPALNHPGLKVFPQ